MTTSPPRRPALTIAIPTLNRAHLVARAVESALAQTCDDLEILVSDNGSTDGTPALLARYNDPRLRHVRHDSTMPATAHGNFLLAQAAGSYFVGLSDDDHLDPGFARRVLDLLQRQPDLAFVYTGAVVHYGAVCVASLSGPEVERGTDFLAAFFGGRREVCWCACVTRTDDLREIGPIPAGRIFGDMYFWTRLAFRGDVGCVAAPLSHYTFMTSDNVSSGTPVPLWGFETRLLADEVLATWARQRLQGEDALRTDCARFVARSTANQFVWNTIRGASRLTLLADLGRCRALLVSAPAVWPRALAALLLPRRLTRHLLLRAAARRAMVRT